MLVWWFRFVKLLALLLLEILGIGSILCLLQHKIFHILENILLFVLSFFVLGLGSFFLLALCLNICIDSDFFCYIFLLLALFFLLLSLFFPYFSHRFLGFFCLIYMLGFGDLVLKKL